MRLLALFGFQYHIFFMPPPTKIYIFVGGGIKNMVLEPESAKSLIMHSTCSLTLARTEYCSVDPVSVSYTGLHCKPLCRPSVAIVTSGQYTCKPANCKLQCMVYSMCSRYCSYTVLNAVDLQCTLVLH